MHHWVPAPAGIATITASRRPILGLVALACISLVPASLEAGPHIPEHDAVVLERLPANAVVKELEPLRVAVRKNPADLRSALRLAEGYLRIARGTSDPRFVSYAQATLEPWLQQEDAPAEALTLAATAMQSAHRFDAALHLLERALALEPRNAQALITRATLLQVLSDYEAARVLCRKLLQAADQLIALTCLANANGMTGRLMPSYRALLHLVRSSGGASGEQGAWIYGSLADMAVRLLDFTAAADHFEAALRLAPDDPQIKAAYADLLLAESRNADVIALLEQDASQDVLLLRLAIAGRRAGHMDAPAWARRFDARRRATRPEDNPHLREDARFLLEVFDRPQEALALARRNWQVQREPADVRLYFAAAARARSVDDERIVRDWVAQTGYQDHAFCMVPRLSVPRCPLSAEALAHAQRTTDNAQQATRSAGPPLSVPRCPLSAETPSGAQRTTRNSQLVTRSAGPPLSVPRCPLSAETPSGAQRTTRNAQRDRWGTPL